MIQLLINLCFFIMSSRNYVTSQRFELEINQKEWTTDFANTDNPDAQNKLSRAKSNLWSLDFLLSYVFIVIRDILGIFTYSAIIITLSPIILIVLIISSLISYFMGKNQIKYVDKHKDITSERSRKKYYISDLAVNFDYAKEVKLYSMTGWLNDMLGKFKFENLSTLPFMGGSLIYNHRVPSQGQVRKDIKIPVRLSTLVINDSAAHHVR